MSIHYKELGSPPTSTATHALHLWIDLPLRTAGLNLLTRRAECLDILMTSLVSRDGILFSNPSSLSVLAFNRDETTVFPTLPQHKGPLSMHCGGEWTGAITCKWRAGKQTTAFFSGLFVFGW